MHGTLSLANAMCWSLEELWLVKLDDVRSTLDTIPRPVMLACRIEAVEK